MDFSANPLHEDIRSAIREMMEPFDDQYWMEHDVDHEFPWDFYNAVAKAGTLNEHKVPAWGLLLQGIWAAVLILPRTFNVATGAYGNLYGDLLTYVISAALIFYILTIAGLFRLRVTMPNLERPYRAIGYPIVPALYIVGASVILVILFTYQTATTWPGLAIIIAGVPAYLLWKRK